MTGEQNLKKNEICNGIFGRDGNETSCCLGYVVFMSSALHAVFVFPSKAIIAHNKTHKHLATLYSTL